jgi:two-component system response regulator YesN
MTTSDQPSAFYGRIGYSLRTEASALEAAAAGDAGACRAAFDKLLKNLDIPSTARDGARVAQLLSDVLQRLNAMLYGASQEEAAYQQNRLFLIDTFTGCNSAVAAVTLFEASLERLLSAIDGESLSSNPIVERACSFIQESYDGRISLSRVARQLAVSPNYLSRIFRREAGMTITAYIQRVRLRHAMRLLGESGRSISEIAYRVGYQNYRDFYRNFVKYEKASPSAVRRRLGSVSSSAERSRQPRAQA